MPYLRCSKCLSKIYCGKDCLTEDWELVHMKICKEEANQRKEETDQRKVKDGRRERNQAGAELQDRMFAESSSMSCAKNKAFLKEVEVACKGTAKDREKEKDKEKDREKDKERNTVKDKKKVKRQPTKKRL